MVTTTIRLVPSVSASVLVTASVLLAATLLVAASLLVATSVSEWTARVPTANLHSLTLAATEIPAATNTPAAT